MRASLVALVSSMVGLVGGQMLDNMLRYSYGSNVLQSYDVYLPDESTCHSDASERYWLVFIHGGFYRDLTVNSTSVQPSIGVLESHNITNTTYDDAIDRLAGIASLNYRIHAFPGVQDPATTPPDDIQNATWPDFLEDVLTALRDLGSRYPIDGRYIVSGHSVGAQLSFLTALRTLNDTSVPKPLAVLGVSGIYDFPQLLQTNPDYVNLTSNAFSDPSLLGPASPAEYPASLYARLHLPVMVLAHSHDDGLVPWDQVETMDAVVSAVPGVASEIVTLYGAHNSIWGGGVQLARAFAETIGLLDKSRKGYETG